MEFTFAFLHLCLLGIYLLTPPLVFLLALIIILGQVAGKIEGWERPNALYWSFITALTIGYGDIRPTKKSTKLLSILIGLTGIIFTGILVAITVTAATKSLSNVIDLSSMSKEKAETATRQTNLARVTTIIFRFIVLRHSQS